MWKFLKMNAWEHMSNVSFEVPDYLWLLINIVSIFFPTKNPLHLALRNVVKHSRTSYETVQTTTNN